MKKIVLLTLICVFHLSSCSLSSEEEIVRQQKNYHIQFNVALEKEVFSFPATRSIPELNIPEPTLSKSGDDIKELKDLCTTIEYLVYTQEESPTLVKHKQFVFDQTNLDTDFGIVYDSLPKGNYQFCFLAHSSHAVALSGSTFSFDDVSDSFYNLTPLNIEVAETVNKDITLERIVNRIEFMATDTVPKELKQFDIVADGVSKQLNILNGNGLASTENHSISHQFATEEIGKSNTIHSFYTFLTADNNKLNVKLSAIDKNDELIRERNISNIMPEKNKIIRYKGRLYSRSESDNTFKISIFNDGKWDHEIEEALPDYE
ncbi:MAG: hypothetical protein WCR86_07300 [Parabacteroides sp.]